MLFCPALVNRIQIMMSYNYPGLFAYPDEFLFLDFMWSLILSNV